MDGLGRGINELNCSESNISLELSWSIKGIERVVYNVLIFVFDKTIPVMRTRARDL